MINSELPEVPSPNSFTLVTELELQAIRKRLIEAEGDLEKAGVSLEEMRNVIYTCRMKANPMQDNGEAPKAKRERKSSSESTNKQKISGDDINNFLG